MDAVTHCVEGYLSINENAPTEAIALDGIYRAVSYIDRAVADGSDKEARYNMAMAALEGGMAIYMGLGQSIPFLWPSETAPCTMAR